VSGDHGAALLAAIQTMADNLDVAYDVGELYVERIEEAARDVIAERDAAITERNDLRLEVMQYVNDGELREALVARAVAAEAMAMVATTAATAAIEAVAKERDAATARAEKIEASYRESQRSLGFAWAEAGRERERAEKAKEQRDRARALIVEQRDLRCVYWAKPILEKIAAALADEPPEVKL